MRESGIPIGCLKLLGKEDVLSNERKASQIESTMQKPLSGSKGRACFMHQDLISIEFSLIDETDRSPLISKDVRNKGRYL